MIDRKAEAYFNRSGSISSKKSSISILSATLVKRAQTPFKLQMFGSQTCHVCTQLEHVFLSRVHAYMKTTVGHVSHHLHPCILACHVINSSSRVSKEFTTQNANKSHKCIHTCIQGTNIINLKPSKVIFTI